MTKEKREQGNKLIAEFLKRKGFWKVQLKGDENYYYFPHLKTKKEAEKLVNKRNAENIPDFQWETYLTYHRFDKNWEELIPAIKKAEEICNEKINYFENSVENEYKNLEDFSGWRSWSYYRPRLSTNIEHSYNSLLNFLKFYNGTKTDNLDGVI